MLEKVAADSPNLIETPPHFHFIQKREWVYPVVIPSLLRIKCKARTISPRYHVISYKGNEENALCFSLSTHSIAISLCPHIWSSCGLWI